MDIENFQVGIEVETPTLPNASYDPLRSYGSNSSSLYRQLEAEEAYGDTMYGWAEGGRITSDISVGAEIVSGPSPDELGGIPILDASDWYADTISRIQRYETHVPVGLMNNSSQTAGLHIHFSHPNTTEVRDFAEWLYNRSEQDEWLRVFACSSIADRGGPTTGQVFRGDRHVKFNGFGQARPNAVAEKSAANGHYEWRMPEPMTTGNFELLMEFLSRAVHDRDAAVEWASELVYQGDTRLTSVARARSIGLDSYEPPTNIDGLQVVRGKSPDTHNFHDFVYDSPAMPFIYRIHTEDGRFNETNYMLVHHRDDDDTFDAPDGWEYLFPDDRGSRWVVEDLNDGGLSLANPEVEADLIDAAANVTQDSEEPIESTAATEVLLDAL